MARILIVDSAEFLRVHLSKILIGGGHQVIEADNGLAAVNIYKTEHPDVVLMDITMPEMGGLQALKEIRAFDAKARVVVLTALGQETVVLEAIKSGARDCVTKPLDADRVLNAIRKALG